MRTNAPRPLQVVDREPKVGWTASTPSGGLADGYRRTGEELPVAARDAVAFGHAEIEPRRSPRA